MRPDEQRQGAAIPEVPEAEQRLRRLVEIGIALGGELSLDDLLTRVVETACELTGARYGALGVIDQSGTALERFVTTGMDDATRTAIGDLPHGRGILGLLIREARPVRLRDLREDPHSVGFPPGHPPMGSFLGVPIMLRGIAYGNLYLTEKADGSDFTDDDEQVVGLLAAQSAVAIENARLYEASTRWLRQLESLSELGDELAAELHPHGVLALVARRLRELVGARLVLVALPTGGMGAEAGSYLVEAADGDGVEAAHGLRFGPRSKLARVTARGRSERIDSIVDDPELDQAIARRLGMHAGLFLPLRLGDRSIGAVLVVDKAAGARPRFSGDDLRLAESVTQRAAVAVELSRRVASESLERILAAQEEERRRLARDLHYETGQGLTSILFGLSALRSSAPGLSHDEALDQVQELVKETLHGVRALAFQLRPSALDDFGLAAALERLAASVHEQTGLAVGFQTTFDDRLPDDVESSVYRLVQEALTNVVKHARARTVSILVARQGEVLAVVVEDDGVGFGAGGPPPSADGGFGLVAMRERMQLLGGDLAIESTQGAGTTLRATIPLP